MIASADTESSSSLVRVENAVSNYGVTYDTVVALVGDTTPIYRVGPNHALTVGSKTDLVTGAYATVHHTPGIIRTRPGAVTALSVEVRGMP